MSGSINDEIRPANVQALEFWKDYKLSENGERREVHWVMWAKRGDLHYNKVTIQVDRLKKPIRMEGGMEQFSPVWLAIRPAYEAWLQGNETPLNGTALDTWPALTKRQLRAFKESGYKTIEDVAAMPESDIPRIKMPDVRKIRGQAQAFLENQKGSAHIEAAMAKRDLEIEALQAQLAEMTKILEARTAPKQEAI